MVSELRVFTSHGEVNDRKGHSSSEKSLQYLIDHPQWFQQHANEAQAIRLCDRLFREQSAIHCMPLIARVQQIIKEACPHFFVQVKIKDFEFTAVKSHLEEQSPFFKAALSSFYTESQNRRIDLSGSEISTGAIASLIEGFQSQRFVINAENAYELYQFADMYALNLVKKHVVAYFKSIQHELIADLQAFQNLLAFSLKYQIPTLIHLCHDSLFTHPELEQKMINIPDAMMFVQTISQNIRLKLHQFYGLQERLFIEVNDKSITEDQIQCVKYLFGVLPSPGISISGKYSEGGFKVLFEAFSNLTSLLVSKSNMRSLPEKWEKSLLEFFCIDCHQLTSLSLFRATHVDLNRLSSLESVYIPRAVCVKVVQANLLKKLELLRAQDVECSRNIQLIELHAPLVKTLRCIQCNPAIQIHASSDVLNQINRSDMAKLPVGKS